MKILLTIVVCKTGEQLPEHDGIEIIYREENEEEIAFLARAAKSAKGKYALISDRPFKIAEVQPLLNILDKNTADMVCFVGGGVIKTSVIRGVVKDCFGCFSCRTLSVLDCKTLLKTVYYPFAFGKTEVTFKDDYVKGILTSADTFGKVKAKLPKEIYSYAFNMLCDRIVLYYMYAMLEIRNGVLPAENLIAFDSKLKAEIVLYLALEKRFTAGNLHKLREKGFKISGFKAKKFKKCLNA